MLKSYKTTIAACCMGNVVMAIIVNLITVLFIPLRDLFGLGFLGLGTLSAVIFITKFTIDILCSRFADKYGTRPFVITAQIFAIAGLTLFAFAPKLSHEPYVIMLISVVIFSICGGLLELMLSPIVHAIPSENKSGTMNLLHSFYAWGQVFVVLLTTVFLWIFGTENYMYIVLMWTAVPALNLVLFLFCPIKALVEPHERKPIKSWAFSKYFAAIFFIMLCGASSEAVVANWGSAFLERGANLPKIVGDTAGVCAFALLLGIGRVYYGKSGDKLDISKAMMWGGVLAFICYIVMAVSPWAGLSLGAVALCGLAVSILWPGSLLLSAKRFPMAGATVFALMACAGDAGSMAGPWIFGAAAGILEKASFLGLTGDELSLRAGFLICAVFPLTMVFILKWIRKRNNKEEKI